ncbi:MAG TPA: hypothetical protein DCG28_04845 [Lachnospiraceae bacterium]|nr:hypothetical protein [Lachnospiraceae bacterium]
MNTLIKNMRLDKTLSVKRNVCAVFTMLFSLLSVMLMSTATFAMSGNGTKNAPYVIKTYDELRTVLLRNCYAELGEDISESEATVLTVGNGVTVHLDLAGHSVSIGKTTGTKDSAIKVNGACLIVDDSGENGSISTSGVLHLFGFLPNEGGELIINSGNFSSETQAVIRTYENAEVTVNGGSFKRGKNVVSAYNIYAAGNSKVTLNGGTFYGEVCINENADFTMNNGTIDSLVVETKEMYETTVPKRILLNKGKITNIILIQNEAKVYLDALLNRKSHFEVGGVKKEINARVYTVENGESLFIVPECNYITSVNVELKEPKYGQTPDLNAIIKTDNVGFYDSESVMWAKDGHSMGDSEIFEAGHSYSVAIWLSADRGYAFSTNGSYVPLVDGTLNGEEVAVNKPYEQDPSEVIELYRDFGYYDPNVTQIDVKVEEPEVGKTPDFNPEILTQGCKFQDYTNGQFHNGISWWDDSDSKPLSPTDTFEKGHDYTLEMRIVPAYNATFNVKNATINGNSVEPWGSNPVWISYQFKAGLIGDVDKNGTVDKKDAATLMKYITGAEPVLTETQLESAKVTDSTKKKPDLLDVMAILEIASKEPLIN